MEAILESGSKSRTSSWGETAAGVLPVAVLCLAISLEGSGSGSAFSWFWIWGAFILLFAVPVVGLLKAIEGGFPRWGAPYFALAVLDAWLIYAVFTQRLFPEPWLDWVMRVGILLLAGYFCFGLVRILRHRPGELPEGSVYGGFGGVKPSGSWSGEADGGQEIDMLFFCAHTFMPLVMLFAFDEIPVAAKSSMILAGAMILVLGGVVYMRVRDRWLGVMGLVVSALAVWGYAGAAAGLYWRMFGWG